MAEPPFGQERGVFTGMKRKTLALLALVVAATITVGAFYTRRGDDAPAFTTEAVSRGDIVNVVSSTGTVQAVTTVEVGSQVSGTIESLNADFNSLERNVEPGTINPSDVEQDLWMPARSDASPRTGGWRGGARTPRARPHRRCPWHWPETVSAGAGARLGADEAGQRRAPGW